MCTDGFSPGSLIQATNGNLYGVTVNGGDYLNNGTVFEITPEGTLTTLHRFDGVDGANPNGLVQGNNGNFYGTTTTGAQNSCEYGCGTVFEISPRGTLTTLHRFDFTDGNGPGGLIQGTDGDFYGSTNSGGTNGACLTYGCGTIFSLNVGLARLSKHGQTPAK